MAAIGNILTIQIAARVNLKSLSIIVSERGIRTRVDGNVPCASIGVNVNAR